MKISIVIPTLNEEKAIEETLADLFENHSPDEVIVADGGSTDQTLSLINSRVKIIHSEKGRAKQMNAGAEKATGDVFLFLHADTRLPRNGVSKIKDMVARGVKAGRFRMRFDDRRWLLRLYETYTRFHFFSYGDQGFFVAKELFEKLSGFDEWVPFEDIDFYKRLRQLTRPVIIKNPVVTSARRFCGVGCLKQKFINLFLVALYYLGFNVSNVKEKLYSEIR